MFLLDVLLKHSTRLLAHAGFDARSAVQFWEDRSASECSTPYSDQVEASNTLVRRIMGSSHPVNELRVESLKSELQRWESIRRTVIGSGAVQRK
jgi:hypothetical protein